MDKTYLPNGALYIAKTKYFLLKKTFYTSHTVAYLMSQDKSVDIDTYNDFLLAESIIRESHIKI